MIDESTARLRALPKFGDGVGLGRVEALLARSPAAAWLARVDAIKITGSKGKGSVAALTEAVLRELGVRAGLFTSPHLFRFAERIRVGEAMIADEALAAAASRVLADVAALEAEDPGDRFGAFEVFVALAAVHFAAQEAETAVLEAGIGGRYDPTRVIPGAIVGLTSVELEHTALLGATHELIAYDKSDLCPSGGTLVIAELDAALERRLAAYCRLRSVELVRAADDSTISAIRYEGEIMRFDLSFGGASIAISSRLLGDHQARNIAIATSLVWRWLQRNRPGVTRAELLGAVSSAARIVSWPGRMDIVARDPTLVIDVGHTPESARTTATTIRELYPDSRILLIVGVSHDKDVSGVLANLVGLADAIVCTRAYHKGSAPEAIAGQCLAIRPDAAVDVAATIEEAVELGRARARAEGMVVLVAGGLFLAIEALAHLRGEDPRALEFF